ncbi:MAG TPA: right-handed parallel beta-helix repeat-containing protein, partial [Actinomycetota bacterium]|nr:right-handed parallel beta-helix repeat-containing protein [Actinomycetota bacterium]
DCLYDGLVVGANGITIDLNGHLIDGKGVGAGIRNDGFDSVTVRNGIVEDFDYGVMLNQGTTLNIVEEMTVQKNQEGGIVLGRPYPVDPALPQPPEPPASYDSNVDSNTIRHNRVLVNDAGVWLTNKAQSNVVEDNEISVNGNQAVYLDRVEKNRVEANEIFGSSGEGILLEGANENTVAGNALEENGGGGITIGLTTTGTAVGIPSNDNTIEANSMFENGGSAIDLEGKSDSYLTGNKFLDNYARMSNGDGISLTYARDSIIRGNDVRQNKGGISRTAATGNTIEANDASESEGDGINLQALSHSNTVLRNISNMNDGTGIYIGDETSGGSGMLLEGNETSNNKGYGIFVPKVSHVIKSNIANDNGGWGIWVSEGSNGRVNIDGGNNRAQGNEGSIDPFTLKPLQCFVIRCEGGPVPQSDAIAPDTIITDQPAQASRDAVSTFRFTGTDNASSVTFQCSIDGGEYGPCTTPKDYAGLAPLSDHTFAVRAVDLSGNVDLTPATYTWWIDPAALDDPSETTFDS